MASSREMAIADRSVRTSATTQTTCRGRKPVRGRWPDNLFPFKDSGGRSGAILTVDIDLLREAVPHCTYNGKRSSPKVKDRGQLPNREGTVFRFRLVLRELRERFGT